MPGTILDFSKETESDFSESDNCKSLLSILSLLEFTTLMLLALGSGVSVNEIVILSGTD